MKQLTRPAHKWRKISLWIVGLIILTAIGIGIGRYLTRDTNPIPPAIRSQLTFSPFVMPQNAKEYPVTDYKFSEVENNVHILSFIVHTPHGTVAVSEYPQPSEFTDIPEYKDRFLSNVANQYATVQTANGTIYLGHAPRQNNKQLGIMIEKGLLLLINPDKELSEAEWRQFGEQLEIQRMVS